MGSRRRTALVSVSITIVILVLGAVAFIYSGAYNVAATEEHTALMSWLLETTQERSVAVRADEVPAPTATDSAALEHGFEHFRSMCATCHGAPGVERSELGKGITPTPPALSEEAPEYTSRELFWITKHGIKMAGMPAFGRTHSDEEIWSIVAFVETLPDLGDEGYASWEARFAAADTGQGAGAGHSHEPGTPSHGH